MSGVSEPAGEGGIGTGSWRDTVGDIEFDGEIEFFRERGPSVMDGDPFRIFGSDGDSEADSSGSVGSEEAKFAEVFSSDRNRWTERAALLMAVRQLRAASAG